MAGGLRLTVMRRRVPFALFSVALGAALLSGCARPETVADRQFAEMREQVDRMEADRDKIDQRLGALETAVVEERSSRVAAAVPAAPPAPIRVVQLGGPSEAESEDPNDPGQRPDIRVTGSGGSGSAAPPSTRSSKSRNRVREDDSSPDRKGPKENR
jgi:outer membrane murein-binding lipoprotein Lpp